MSVSIDFASTFVTSDTHFGHRLMAEIRGFETVADHDEFLIEQWNTAVLPTNTVIHMGDVAFLTAAKTEAVFKRLNGNILIVPGNHDNRRTLVRAVGAENVMPPIQTFKWDGGRMVACHFPIASWEGAERGVPHLHGHMHTGTKSWRTAAPNDQVGLRRDVGVDNSYALGWMPYAPIPLMEAIRP